MSDWMTPKEAAPILRKSYKYFRRTEIRNRICEDLGIRQNKTGYNTVLLCRSDVERAMSPKGKRRSV